VPKKSNKNSQLIGRAIKIACETHGGQVDKAGDPYLFHTFRIGMSLWPDVTATVVGLVHDTIEDSDKPRETWQRIYDELGSEIAVKVSHLSRKRGQSYDRYIEEVSMDNVCRKVKIADLKDNMDWDRVRRATENGATNMVALLEKYRKALAFLERVEG
jgi:(p)ppGpp synthase/HD superfamily hydrolase